MSINIPDKQKTIIEDLLNKVKTMSNDEFKAMLAGFQKFHNYSFFNKCLIYSSGASQVAGFNKWKDLNRWVKKKEQHTLGAIQILAPKMVYEIRVGDEAKQVSEKYYKDFTGQKRCFPVSFFSVTVFDIQDTDGQALEEPMTKFSKVSYTEVLGAAERLGFTVELRPLEFNKGGCISKKHITINSNRQESANVGTLVHELAHGLLGHTDTDCDHSQSLVEQQAETVTYMVCKELGIERNSEFYLKSWGLSDNIMMDFAQLSKVAQKLTNEIRTNSMRFILDD